MQPQVDFCVGEQVIGPKGMLGEIVTVITQVTHFFLLKCDGAGYVNAKGKETIWFTNPAFEFPASAIVEEFCIGASNLPAFEVKLVNAETLICSLDELESSRKKPKCKWTLMWHK